MNEKVQLPDPNEFFGIRFESIGGLGAHAAGQILATTAVLRMNLNGAHFSSYGSEKKGSVIRSFIRLAALNKSIRSSAPIESPDVIVIFHSALLNQKITIAGMKAGGTLIYNGAENIDPPLLSELPKDVKVIRVNAQKIAVEEKSRPNAVLLGTLTAAVPFLDFDTILQAFSDEFMQRHPEAVASNEKAFRRGAKEFEVLSNVGKAEGDLPIMRPSPIWGYKTAPIGGILPTPGNTVSNDLTVSRMGWIPVFHVESCIHCAMCDMVCPDFCLVWKQIESGEVQLQGVDYRYCKGCLRCVETCPTKAFTKEIEQPGLADKLRVK
ncbi:MAG: 2-oxoacid:acceptor oxidoreductase family protein, partial [Thiomargarita sp.]|nr:2-oxoacid:acceptor oxidoreductase family protein [Thiomargarita sp.]